jgi:two-component system chemotaxis response regulator CheB
LVVDDSALVRKVFGRVLSAEADIDVQFARNGVEGLAMIESFKPHVVTLDVQMPQMDGLACLDRIMIERPCPVVMVSALTDEGADATLEALRLGAVDFVAKPGGTVSLSIDEFGPVLVAKVRAAFGAKLPATRRLRERIQHKIGNALPPRRRTAPAAHSTAKPVPAQGNGMVLVGASTGGPPALEALLSPLPASFPWPILIAQHMPAAFTGPLAARLNRLCALEVKEVARTQPLERGCVYIGRGDGDLIVTPRAGRLAAMPAPAQEGYPWHPSADRLVRSALQHMPAAQLVGVLLTGMGNDGAAAMTALRAEGGTTIAEAEETAVVWGMPGELVASGGASHVLPMHLVAERLLELVPSDALNP